MYGHHTGALFGYSETFGGFDGCQAEYVRVPFADVNLFPIPDNVDDKNALLVADILCTGYHGNELAGIKEGDKVVVFGCGPVGLVT
jgi:threonine dehydrogenase-like Zn-dependent dehydrogenase